LPLFGLSVSTTTCGAGVRLSFPAMQTL
jgi:hypothetical protein